MSEPGARQEQGYDVIVLAGGSARRLGGLDKPALAVAGRRLLDRVLDGCADAARVVIVGPERPVPAGIEKRMRWCREQPAGGGPLAAVAAAVPHTAAEVVVVVAADMPFVAPAIPVLAELAGGQGRRGTSLSQGSPPTSPRPDAVTLVDTEGFRQPLAAAYRREALLGRLAAHPAPAGLPARTLLMDLEVAELSVGDLGGEDVALDCDRWEDVHRAEAVVARRHQPRLPGPPLNGPTTREVIQPP